MKLFYLSLVNPFILYEKLFLHKNQLFIRGLFNRLTNDRLDSKFSSKKKFKYQALMDELITIKQRNAQVFIANMTEYENGPMPHSCFNQLFRIVNMNPIQSQFRNLTIAKCLQDTPKMPTGREMEISYNFRRMLFLFKNLR